MTEAELQRGCASGSDRTRLLFVDDHEQVREMVKAILEDFGFEVVTAGDGEEAVSLYERDRGAIDLVLLDMVMPKLDGRAAFARLKEIDPDVKVLLSTGYTDDPATEELLGEGARGLLQKPYQPDQLVEAIRTAIDASS